MSGEFHLYFTGLWGNQLFQYAFARGYCERHGLQLHTEPWPGHDIFDLHEPPAFRPDERLAESHLIGQPPPSAAFSFRSYCQQQGCADYYTKRQVQQWLRFRPEVLARLAELPEGPLYLAHRRRGDYQGFGYVVVSDAAYKRSIRAHGLDPEQVRFLTGHGYVTPPEDESTVPGLPQQFGFLRDFWWMMNAQILWRSNSTFAWWASTLGDPETWAPLIEGREGGREHDCDFIRGNWPRFANLAFTTDLHLADE